MNFKIANDDELKQTQETVVSVANNVSTNATNLVTHISDDVARWQYAADLETKFLVLSASIQNKVLDAENFVDITSSVEGTGYLVSSPLGGLITVTYTNILVSVANLQINNVEMLSQTGLSLLNTITVSYEVEGGNMINGSGLTSVIFTPYIGGTNA